MAIRIFLALVLLVSGLHLFTGYADNGDFSRSTHFVFDKPVGFSANWPQDPLEQGRRFTSAWHDRWEYLHEHEWPDWGRLFSFSSYKIYLLLQASVFGLLSSWTGAEVPYSLIIGSLLSRAIFLIGIAGLLLVHGKHLTGVAFWCLAALLSFIALESSWIAYLNSFYEDQVVIVFMPIFACLIVEYLRRREVWTGLTTMVLATFIGAAKTAYFYLPALTALFLFPMLRRRFGIARVVVLVAISQSLALVPVLFDRYQGVNSYFALYYGTLKVLNEDEIDRLATLGSKPILRECVGVSGFGGAKNADCLKRAGATYRDVFEVVVREPRVIPRLATEVARAGTQLNLKYAKSMLGAPDFSGFPLFRVFREAFSFGLNTVALVLTLASLGFVIKNWTRIDSAHYRLLRAGCIIGSFGALQYPVSLAAGLGDIFKHLLPGNFALALAFALIVSAFVQIATQSSRQSAPEIPPLA